MTQVLLIAFLASLGLDWPQLPFNVRLAEPLALAAGVAVLARGGNGLRWRALDTVVLAYFCASVLAVATSPDPSAGVVELARHAYVIGIYAIVALAVRRNLARAARAGLALMGAAPAAAALVGAVAFALVGRDVPAVGEAMKLPYVGEMLRLRGFTASPTMFACVLTMAIPCALAAAVNDAAARRIWSAGVAVMLIAAVMTFSHVWAGVALAVVVCGWPLLEDRRGWRVAAVTGVVLLAVGFNLTLVASARAISSGDARVADATTYPYGVGDGRAVIGSYTIDYSVMSYFRIKQLATEAFLERPLTGIGLDRFHTITEAAYHQGRLPHGYRHIDPHSSLLGRLAETGIVGGATLAALWAAAIFTGAALSGAGGPERWTARAAYAGILGLLLAGINVDIMNFRFFWAGLGLLRGFAELRA